MLLRTLGDMAWPAFAKDEFPGPVKLRGSP